MLKSSFGKVLSAAFLSTALFAQDATRGTTEQQIRDKLINEDRAAARRSLAVPGSKKNEGAERQKQGDRFSNAVEAYRAAVAADAALEKPLKEMEEAIVDLEKYFRTRGTPKRQKTEFAGLSRPELAAETLKSAERLKADLPGLVKLAEDPSIIVGRWDEISRYVADLHRETLRLKFLISKTRSAR
jgi:hypothetical protein